MINLKKILFILNPHERKLGFLLLVTMFVMALLDTIGVASIMPFIAVLSNPQIIETNGILNFIFRNSKIFGVNNDQQFLFLLGFLVFFLLIISLVFKAFTTYAQARFSEMRGYAISSRLIRGYLFKPYTWFLQKNSSEISKNILEDVGIFVGVGLGELMQLVSKGLISILILILLIIVDPKLALIVGVILCGIYWIIFYFLRNRLNLLGKEYYRNNELRFRYVSEAFNATRVIKLHHLEKNYTERFSKAAEIFAKTATSSEIIRSLPRFFLEALIFGGVMIIILYLMVKTGSFGDSLPILSLYVFAGYRLMPALQQVYASLTRISFANSSTEKIYNEFKKIELIEESKDKNIFSINKSINLKNIHYQYPNSEKKVIEDISLSIPAKSKVGFIGTTGSGKTTIVDIILGLLEPIKGTLEVDDKILTSKNLRSWQRNIGYVPQDIYLADDTIASNIAFGLDPKDIDQKALENASKIANIHEFIVEELPNKYKTIIGERGVRLSGGQCQRIAIARALYQNPKVLILDEATSALDNDTEKAVMDAINNLHKEITIIIIAHRLNTIKDCDIIFKIDKGKIVDQGVFSDLISKN